MTGMYTEKRTRIETAARRPSFVVFESVMRSIIPQPNRTWYAGLRLLSEVYGKKIRPFSRILR